MRFHCKCKVNLQEFEENAIRIIAGYIFNKLIIHSKRREKEIQIKREKM